MDLDEYDYLEKAVEEANGHSAKKETTPDKGKEKEKSEKGYRRRERSEDDDELISEERGSRKSSSKKSRSEENGRDRDKQRDEDRDRYRDRSLRHRSRDHDSEKDRRSSRDRRRDSRERRDDDSEKDRRSSRDRHRDSRERKEDDSEKVRQSSRDKERDRNRDSRERRDREREKEKERERREREREMERERSRRSRSGSRLEHERERDLLRERERPDSRRYRDKKESEPEADPERDQRTVFAYQMPLKATERDVYEFFSKAGKVRDVKLIMDRNSRRSKGVGYIEFVEAMSVPMAIAMSGHPFLGQPIMVKPSEAEKNLVQSTASATSSGVIGSYGASDRKLYVGNLHFNMNEIQLRQIFEAFGPVELVQLPTDPETGHCKGFGFIQFAQLEHAKAAVSLNGSLEIAGRTIKVSSVTDHVGVQDLGTKTADFDDDEGGGLALNAQSRAMLMQKLDRSGIVSSVVGPLINGSVPSQQMMNPTTILPPQVFTMVPEPIGTPSECLLLKNMFDPATETEPEFDLDIRDDVQEECSKYGRVKHIYVDKNSAGYVYLRFESVEAASRAQQAMHKRWFARKMISAIFLQPYEYDAKFKGAA